jgi:hypothetical protein
MATVVILASRNHCSFLRIVDWLQRYHSFRLHPAEKKKRLRNVYPEQAFGTPAEGQYTGPYIDTKDKKLSMQTAKEPPTGEL